MTSVAGMAPACTAGVWQASCVSWEWAEDRRAERAAGVRA